MRNTLLSGLSSLLLPLGLYGASATAGASYQRTYLSSSISASSDQPLRSSTALPRDLIDLSGDQLDIQTAHPVRELVVVDGAVTEADKSVLRRALKPGVQLVELDSSTAGLPQLINALRNHKNLAAIHVVSHAEAGAILLGNSRITTESIQQEVHAFAALNGAVREGGDLLFYGCELAANQAGEELLDIISNKTGLDVAASNNLTGNAELQGDWDLEVTRGNVEAELAFSEKTLRDFSGVLVASSGTKNFASGGWADNNNNLTSTDFIVTAFDTGGSPITNISYNVPSPYTDVAYLESGYNGSTTGTYFYVAADGTDTGSFELTGLVAGEYLAGQFTNVHIVGIKPDNSTVMSSTLTGTGGTDTFTFAAGQLGNFSGVKLKAFKLVFDTSSASNTKPYFEFRSFSITGALAPNTVPTTSNLNGDSVAWAGVGSTVSLDASSNANLTDTELDALNASNGNWADATLTIQRSGTAITSDTFGFNTSGALFTVSGSNLQSGGQTFATFTNTNGVLTITFTSSGTTATSALVDNVAQRITYGSDIPAGDATVSFVLTDGDGGTATTANVTVTSDSIYVTNTTDTATITRSDGVSFSEAIAIAAADATGSQTIIFDSSLASQSVSTSSASSLGESLTVNLDSASGVTLTGGTLSIGSGFGLTVTNGTTDTATIATAFSGNGSVIKSGTGTLTLSGTNSYAGTTTASAGTLAVSSDSNLGSGTVTLASSTTLQLTGSTTIDNAISLSGSATLQTDSVVTLSGVLSGGAVTLTKTGSSQLRLSNTGNEAGITGGTTVTAGTLTISEDNALPAGTLTLNGATFSNSISSSTVTLDNAIVIGASGGTVNVSNNPLIVSADISGAGALNKTGGQQLTLSGNNTFSGGIAMAGANGLSITDGTNLGSGTFTMNSGTFTVTGSGITLSHTIVVNGDSTISNANSLTLSGGISGGSSLTKAGAGTLTLSGTNSYADTTLSAGSLSIASDSNLGSGTVALGATTTLAVTGATTIDNAITLSGNATLNISANATMSGVIGGGANGLTKAGGSQLTLSGANTYSGATTVSAGTLLVSGSTDSAATVASGATLAGGGTIDGAVTVQNGGTLSPGSSPGTLTINGNLDMDSGSTLVIEINGTTAGTNYDQIIVTGAVDVSSATLSATHSYVVGNGDSYTIIVNDVADAVTGTFNGLAEGSTFAAGGNSTVLTTSYIGGTGNDITLTAPFFPSVTSVSTIDANSTYNIGDTITLVVNFSEAVFLSTGTIQLMLETGTTDRAASYLAGSGSSSIYFSYTIQAGDIAADLDYTSTAGLVANGDTIQSGSFVDVILTLPTPGAANSLGNGANLVVDGVRPTAGIVVTDTALAAGETSSVTITFDEPVSGLAIGDFTVANGVLSNLSSGDGGITWTATFTPDASVEDPSNLITLDNTAYVDAAGNTGTATTDSNNYAIDTARPSASVVVADSALAVGETSLVTITFNEAISGLAIGDFTVANGALSGLSSGDGGITWTATFTPDASVEAPSNLITLDNTAYIDAVGNTGTGITDSNSYAIDTVSATASIVVADTALAVGETSVVTITFSEAVSGLAIGDLTVANGVLSSLSTGDAGITWTATLTPDDSVEDPSNLIALDNTGVIDAAGNAGTGTTDSNNYAIDTVRPSASVAVADTALTAGETSTVTITFNEAVSGLAIDDFTVANGVLSSLSSGDGGITWTATLTPDDSVEDPSNLITLDNSGVIDAAGNAGTGTTDSNNYAIDTARPSASIVVADTALAVGETSTVTIAFNEAVSGLAIDDFTVANGALSGLSSGDGGITWTATLTPDASVEAPSNLITLDNTAYIDATGNTGTSTTDSNNYAIDTLRPTASIVVADTALVVGETSLVTISFSEAVTGFANDDLTIASGTLNAVSSGDGGITWTATLTPNNGLEDPSNVITLDNTAYVDAAGNTGTGTTDSNNYGVDAVAPINSLPAAQVTDTITPLVFSSGNGNALSVSDGDNLTVVIAIGSGSLTATTSGAAGIANNGTGTVTISGTAAEVNTALEGLSYTPDGAGAQIFSIQSTDTVGNVDSDNLDITVNNATLLVTSNLDTGDDETTAGSFAADQTDASGLSIREALHWVRAGDTISFDLDAGTVGNQGGSITLNGNQLQINYANIKLDGDLNDDGVADVSISANNASRVMAVGSSLSGVEITGLTLTQGSTATAGAGLNINFNASITVRDSNITNNTDLGGGGGGVYGSAATLTMINSTVSGNTSSTFGGGIRIVSTGGTLNLINSTVSGNTTTGASAHGGGIQYGATGGLTIINSTISGNATTGATSFGGGLRITSGTASLYNTTIVGNASTGSGGGVHANGSDTFVNTVVAGNTSGAGATAGASGSPLATGGAADDVGSTVETATNSYFGSSVTITTNNSCLNNQGTSSLLLGDLANYNGSAIQTHRPQTGSALLEAGSSADLPADSYDLDGDLNTAEALPVDANGDIRVSNLVDIGAVEGNAVPVLTGVNGGGTFIENGSAIAIDSDASVSDNDLDLLNSGDGDYNGASLVVVRNGGAVSSDSFGFSNGNGVSLLGSDLVKNSLTIASFDTSTAGQLTVSFTSINSEIPERSDVNAILQQITYSSSSEAPGTSADIDITLSDGAGASVTETASLTLTEVNDAPTASATGGTPTFTEGGLAVDLFSGVSLSTIEAGQSIIGLSLNVTNLSNGSAEILAIDGSDAALSHGNSLTTATNSLELSVSVTGNTAVVTMVKPAGVTTAALSTLIDAISYRNTSNNPGALSRVVTLTTLQDSGGTANGGIDTASLAVAATVAMSQVNEAPVIGGSPATSVNEDSGYSFTPAASDGDSEGLVFGIVNKPTWAAFNTATGALTGTPTNANVGTTTGIQISVSDGSLSASLPVFNLTVANVNDAPVISGTPATSVDQDAAYSFIPTASDADAGATLTYSIVNKPSWAAFNTASGALTGMPTNADVGTTSAIVISVSDGSVSASLPAFDLSVVNVNEAPVISGTPATSVDQDAAYSFTPTASDVDAGTTLTYSIVNKPTWATFNTATGALTGTPTNADVGTTSAIVISVSDGSVSASLPAFDLSVVNVNEAPVISGTPAVAIDQDLAYSFTPTATDADVADVLSFSIANKPTWASFNSTTGALTGTPAGADVGISGGIVISVTDGIATVALPAFAIEVIATTDPLQPIVTAPADRELNAVALFTPVDVRQLLGLNPGASAAELELALKGLASDGVSGNNCCTTTPEGLNEGGNLLLAPGRHEVKWKATNAAGVTGEAIQVVNIKPLVSLGKSQIALRGKTIEFRVLLNGVSPVYPLTIPFSIDPTTTATAAEYTIGSGSAVFTEQGQLEVSIPVTLAAVTGFSDSQLVIALGDGINAGATNRHVIDIRQGNVPPVVYLAITQGGLATNLISPSGSPVTVSANVVDANDADTHSFDWSATSGLADTDGNPTNASRSFNPSGLAGGHQLKVTVTDSAGASVQAAAYFRVVNSLPVLDVNTDTDKDGINDNLEGTGDTDDNGIPDYLDNMPSTNILPQQGNTTNTYLIECDPGVRCGLGLFARSGNSGGVQILDQEVGTLDDLVTDPAFEPVGGVFDFAIRDLPTPGQSVRVVIPQRAAIPANAVYRKFQRGRWVNFIADADNAVHSAAGNPGYCPPPGSADWTPGLTAGHLCVQLTIEDGGANDDDGLVNSAVVDPGAVSEAKPVEPPPVVPKPPVTVKSSGGGSIDGAWILLLGALLMIKLISNKNAQRVSLVALVLASAGTQAADTGYLRLELLQAEGNVSANQFRQGLTLAGHDFSLEHYDVKRTGFQLSLGHTWDNHTYSELGYLSLGDVDVDFTLDGDADMLAFKRDLAASYPLTAKGLTWIHGVTLLRDSPVSVSLEGGVFMWQDDKESNRAQLTPADDSGFAPLATARLDWHLSQSWSLGFNLRRIYLADQEVDTYGLSTRWSF